jgi:hypothetical protein
MPSPRSYATSHGCGNAYGGGGGGWKKMRLWKKMADVGLIKKIRALDASAEVETQTLMKAYSRPKQERMRRATRAALESISV